MSAHSTYLWTLTQTGVTATAATSSLHVSDYIEANAVINLTSITAGTFDIKLQVSADDVVWADYPTSGINGFSFAQMTSASTKVQSFRNFGKYIRFYYTIAGGGTLSFTIQTVLKT